MFRSGLAAGLMTAMLLAFSPSAHAQADSPQARCTALAGLGAAVEARLVRLPDAPTRILSAKVMPAADGLPEACRIEGLVAPNTGFELRLPTTTWNGKFLMVGCGGYCGTIAPERSDPGLARNYAVVQTDMGHRGASWLFAYNNIQGEIDFAYRSTHTVAVAAKEIIDAYYGKRAQRNYFMGCSTGGRQAMVEAQRFPRDFDGIVAGAPVYDETGDGMLFVLWSPRANLDADGKPILDAKKLPLIHDAVLEKCDARDGRKDGILQDPRTCDWQPAELQCRRGQRGDTCLTEAEVAVVNKIYSGATDAAGEPWYFGMSRGSEYTWTPEFIGADGKLGSWIDGPQSFAEEFATTMPFFYDPPVGTPAASFDFDRDPPRMGLTEIIYNAQNPDLRKFKKAGGKLILYHGWDDDQIPPGLTVDYYETATRTMGGPDQTKDFFRLFMLPSALHCSGGPGGSEVDWITAIETWVEQGRAPDEVIVHRMANDSYTPRPRHPLAPGQYTHSRPVYPYPDVARYSGSGNPAEAANWRRAPRE